MGSARTRKRKRQQVRQSLRAMGLPEQAIDGLIAERVRLSTLGLDPAEVSRLVRAAASEALRTFIATGSVPFPYSNPAQVGSDGTDCFIGFHQAADRLGVEPAVLGRWLDEGLLPHRRTANGSVLHRQAVEHFALAREEVMRRPLGAGRVTVLRALDQRSGAAVTLVAEMAALSPANARYHLQALERLGLAARSEQSTGRAGRQPVLWRATPVGGSLVDSCGCTSGAARQRPLPPLSRWSKSLLSSLVRAGEPVTASALAAITTADKAAVRAGLVALERRGLAERQGMVQFSGPAAWRWSPTDAGRRAASEA